MYKELELILPNLIYNYGNLETFLQVLQQEHPLYYNHIVIELLGNSKVVVLSGIELNSALFEKDESGLLTPSSIILDRPYRIYSVEGKLLYSVLDHGGYFGYDPRDRDLLVKAKSLDFYYLTYDSYEGPQIYLVVLNKYQNMYRLQELRNKQHEVSVNETDSQTSINSINIVNDGGLDLQVFSLVGTPSTRLTREEIAVESNLLTTVPSGEHYALYPEEAGYLVFKVGEDFVEVEASSDRWITTGLSVYYLACDTTSPVLLKRIFGLSTAPTSSVENINFNLVVT